MDIKIKSDEGRFKFRVCGIVEKDEKILVMRMNENKFYCLPGGHVELGEDTNTAILREMKEELAYEVQINKLACVHQNLFKTENGKPFHEIGFYYSVSPKNKNFFTENLVRMENDKGQIIRLEMNWVTKEELKELDFRPQIIREIILKNNDNFECYITKE